ncbi:MAG: hypothetical protein EA385_07845 [Salinarimonadaceae bacterium]|nr:MAG: hypothetical protein EA385_07845 [Salinarimonadaceae bacterium]
MSNMDVQGRLIGLSQRQDLPEDARIALAETVRELRTPLQTDAWIYRIVVAVLGAVALTTVIGGIMLVYYGRGDAAISLPAGIVAIGSAAVGALAGLLAPSPRGNG